jgi:SAM-dependent methyltransferase
MNIAPYLERYRAGEWRDSIFRDVILNELQPQERQSTILDVGCGRGFDSSIPIQASIARVAGTFIGVEPDFSAQPASYFTVVHRTSLEDAPIEPESVDLAYAVMVLEHLRDPEHFFAKVWNVLVPRGVFWALTVDRRHWFCSASNLMERLRIKELYLRALLGRRGTYNRYDNYPVYYRSNCPSQIAPFVRQFSRADYYNFARLRQANSYFPPPVRPLITTWDKWALRRDKPGILLLVRLEK